MLTRFLAVIVAGMFLEVGAFAYVHRDSLALTTDWAIWETSREVFEQRADRLLRQPKLTRKQVEQIASRARTLQLPAIEARALSAYGRLEPQDHELRLRQADALRRAGALKEAEQVYLDLLNAAPVEGR
jgi:hypothetical protein